MKSLSAPLLALLLAVAVIAAPIGEHDMGGDVRDEGDTHDPADAARTELHKMVEMAENEGHKMAELTKHAEHDAMARQEDDVDGGDFLGLENAGHDRAVEECGEGGGTALCATGGKRKRRTIQEQPRERSARVTRASALPIQELLLQHLERLEARRDSQHRFLARLADHGEQHHADFGGDDGQDNRDAHGDHVSQDAHLHEALADHETVHDGAGDLMEGDRHEHHGNEDHHDEHGLHAGENNEHAGAEDAEDGDAGIVTHEHDHLR